VIVIGEQQQQQQQQQLPQQRRRNARRVFGRLADRARHRGPALQAAAGRHQGRRLRRVREGRGRVRRRGAGLPRRMGLHAGTLGRALRGRRGAPVPGGQGRRRRHVVLRHPGLQARALGMPQGSHGGRPSAVAGG